MSKSIPDDMEVISGIVTREEIVLVSHDEALRQSIEAVTAHTQQTFEGLDEEAQRRLTFEFQFQVLTHRYVELEDGEALARAALDAVFIFHDHLPPWMMVFVLVHGGPELLEDYVAEHDGLTLWRGDSPADEGHYYCGVSTLCEKYAHWKQAQQYLPPDHPIASCLSSFEHFLAHAQRIVLQPGERVCFDGEAPDGHDGPTRRQPPGSRYTTH